jgi:DNA/RNA endonuclease YhcR with UshA esterase domain
VYANEETFVATPLKFGCVIRINVAKPNALGTTVTIAGVVTAQPGRFRNDNMYIQDQTGGIQVFGVSAALGLIEGDSVEVTGELAAFNDQLQINAPRIAPNVKRGAAIPDPILITTGQAAAATTPLSANIGRLVRVQKVTVGTFASGNAPMDDGSGGTLLRLDSNANTTIGTGRFTAGTCYNITGILGFFRGATQLQPRGPQDVTEVSCS